MKKLRATLLLTYFRLLAKIQLAKIQPTIIGITGSAGKSTTMEAVAAVLEPQFTLKVGRKANSESGIPLNILGLTPRNFSILEWLRLVVLAPWQLLTNWRRYQVYVVEMGIDGPFPPKNMSYLLSILKPKIGVFTSVAAVHSEPFDVLVKATDPEERKQGLIAAIAAEKAKLIHALPSEGTAVVNLDDAAVMSAATPTKARLVTFGTSPQATLYCDSVTWHGNATSFVFKDTEFSAGVTIGGALLPEHVGQSFAAALCVGSALGISLPEAARNLQTHFKLPPGRASIIAGIHGSTIIDSSYNSSAQPCIDILKLLKQLPHKQKLALLGDIRELGSAAQSEHERVATAAAEILDAVYLVGPLMQQYALPIFQEKGIPAFWFPSAAQAAVALTTQLSQDTVLLVKGSQNTLLLEIAVEKLLAHPEQAEQLLARRGEYWDSERQKLLT